MPLMDYSLQGIVCRDYAQWEDSENSLLLAFSLVFLCLKVRRDGVAKSANVLLMQQ